MPKSKSTLTNILLFAMFVVTIARVASAQPAAPGTSAAKAIYQTPTWIGKKWESDDKPYLQVQSAVNAAVAKSKNKSQLIASYRESWVKKPASPVDFFRYAYGKYQILPRSGNELFKELNRLALDFNKLPAPESYRYTRLRFLVEVRSFANPQLKPLAKRFLERDKQDANVL